MVGKVGLCSKKRPGLITGQKEMPWGLAWVGEGLDGHGPWCSREPVVLANSIDEWRLRVDTWAKAAGAL